MLRCRWWSPRSAFRCRSSTSPETPGRPGSRRCRCCLGRKRRARSRWTRRRLFRARLLRIGEAHHVLQLVMHHIVADGWSLGVIDSDLDALYRARLTGGSVSLPVLPALPVRFTDFVAWQRTRLQGERLEKLLAFWRDKLSGLERLALPADRPRPVETTRGRMTKADLSAQLFARLQAFARSENATVFMVLLAAFKLA